jgi:hypothetical protein
MLIRYVIGRPVPPKEPVRLKAGGISRDKNRDTTEALYLAACEELDQHPVTAYVEHLRERDLRAWQFRQDIYASPELVSAALHDARTIQNTLAKVEATPPRNAWQCAQCDWRIHCEGDPLGNGLEHWHDVGDAPTPSALEVSYGRTRKTLNRGRTGYACSPSELRAFMQCPRLWWIEYHQRKRLHVEGMGALKRMLGSITHEALRIMTIQPNLNVLREVELLVVEICRTDAVNAELRSALMEEAQILAIAERAKAMHSLAMEGVAEVVECEQRRAMVLPGTKKWLHGIPDAVVRMEDGRLAVVEYKTTYAGNNLARTADRYRNSNPAVFLYAALVQYGALTLRS